MGFCAPPDGSVSNAAEPGDAAVDGTSDGAARDADSAVGDATVSEGGADAVSDAGREAEGAAAPDGSPDGTGPIDTGADRTNPVSDGAGGGDAADAGTDASDATAMDTGIVTSDANETNDGSCSVSPAGTCSQCSGSCSIRRPGFLPNQGGGVTILDAHTFLAVQITVPSLSWLLRLGIQTSMNNLVGELALYEDSQGQPGTFVTKVDVTTLYDQTTDGTEESVDCDALCIPLAAGTYWVGAVFESSLNVLSDNENHTTIYQGNASYPDGGTLADGVVPPGTVSAGVLDRNIYMVVTAP
jgi:hypothetical protein